MLACADPRPNPTRDLFAWQPLAFVGERTYGLYLWHWPIYLALAETPVGDNAIAIFVVSMVLTVAVAHLSYNHLEQPIIKHGIRGILPRTRETALASVLPVALVALLAVGLVRTAPEEERPTPAAAVASLPDVVEGQPSLVAGEPARIGVLGDSVPYFLAERFPR